jgi:hypothetical protein
MPLRIQETFLFNKALKPALGFIKLISNGHCQHFSKGLGDYVVNLPSFEVKNACSSSSTPLYVHGLKLGPNDSLFLDFHPSSTIPFSASFVPSVLPFNFFSRYFLILSIFLSFFLPYRPVT